MFRLNFLILSNFNRRDNLRDNKVAIEYLLVGRLLFEIDRDDVREVLVPKFGNQCRLSDLSRPCDKEMGSVYGLSLWAQPGVNCPHFYCVIYL